MDRDKKVLFKYHEVRNTLASFANTVLDDFYRDDDVLFSETDDPCFSSNINHMKERLFRHLEFYVERDLKKWVKTEESEAENNHATD